MIHDALLTTVDRLGHDEARDVHALAAAAQAADGVAALSEDFVLGVGSAREGSRHLLARTADGDLACYGQRHADGSAELVTAPTLRRRGHGRAVLRALLAHPGTRVWAHGTLPAAVSLAASEGLDAVRTLHLMARRVTSTDRDWVDLPAGYTARPFRPGTDDEALVATNAAAFADHPEQGRMTLANLHDRMQHGWFDPAGLLVLDHQSEIEHGHEPHGIREVVAFHWTKIEDPATGEIYVVGVDPAHQGRGLAGPLTRLGIAHLARRRVERIVLYVDGDNERALRTYRREGFTDAAVDTMYASTDAGPAPATPL